MTKREIAPRNGDKRKGEEVPLTSNPLPKGARDNGKVSVDDKPITATSNDEKEEALVMRILAKRGKTLDRTNKNYR
jgi:hypothetical protein